jgi:chromodomain-helicase-DNA-binding protein 1
MLFYAGHSKKGNRGPTFKLSSVTVNAKSVIQALTELEPLAEVMPASKEDRKK